MNTAVRWLIVVTLLIAAIGSYTIGSTKSLGIFLVLGVIFELCFWFGIFGDFSKKKE